MPEKLIVDPVTGLFSVVFCVLCKYVKMQHNRLAVVSKGGKPFFGGKLCVQYGL